MSVYNTRHTYIAKSKVQIIAALIRHTTTKGKVVALHTRKVTGRKGIALMNTRIRWRCGVNFMT